MGLIKRKEIIPPHTQQTLSKIKSLSKPGRVIGESLYVDTPDRVIIRYHGFYVTLEEAIERESINQVPIVSIPSFWALLVFYKRRYTWKP